MKVRLVEIVFCVDLNQIQFMTTFLKFSLKFNLAKYNYILYLAIVSVPVRAPYI